MKKTWNKLIIVSFIVLAVVACAAIVFLYPYYNEYKVFDGIEAGQWNEVQKSYEALDSEKQKAVQEMLGHADVSSTQIYLGLNVSKMRDVYMKAHPRH